MNMCVKFKVQYLTVPLHIIHGVTPKNWQGRSNAAFIVSIHDVHLFFSDKLAYKNILT